MKATWRTEDRVSDGYCMTATCWVRDASNLTVRSTTSSRSTAPPHLVDPASERPGLVGGALALRYVECQVYDATVNDRYGSDVLSGDWRVPKGGRAREVEAETGLVVEDVETGWCGAVVRVEKAGGMQVVHLEDRGGRSKGFPLGPGFLLDGAPVVLTRPTAVARAAAEAAKVAASRTASGSRALEGVRARVASGSRIFVEGKHDAELVEKVWGDDLRIEGVVVEMLD